ncbi:hypothetical protein V2G26_001341 [Clonostachys chloroleuca]
MSSLLVIAGECRYLASGADSERSCATAGFSTLAVLSRVCNVPLSHKPRRRRFLDSDLLSEPRTSDMWKEIDASISNFLVGGCLVEVGHHSFTFMRLGYHG